MLLAPLQEIAKTPMFSKWMDEQILVYSYTVILLNNRKEQTTDTLNNVGEPHRHYAERAGRHQRVHTVMSQCMWNLKESKISYSEKSDQYLLEVGDGGEAKMTAKRHRELSWKMEMFFIIRGDGYIDVCLLKLTDSLTGYV